MKEGEIQSGLSIRRLGHSLDSELHDLGVEKEARKRMMAHESDAASSIYGHGGDGGKQAACDENSQSKAPIKNMNGT